MINEFYVCDAQVVLGADGLYYLFSIEIEDVEITRSYTMDNILNFCKTNKIHIIKFSKEIQVTENNNGE